MSLTKAQIQKLEQSMAPPQKKFSLLQVIQKFPDNPHMHETFRQICLHYEESTLSFNQIMQYLFGQFNRNSDSVNASSNRLETLRVLKNYNEQEFKVALLGAYAHTQRINQLIMVDNSITDSSELYVATNTTIRQFNMKNQSFMKQIVELNNMIVQKASVCGNLILFLNKQNQLYFQILPMKLAEQAKIDKSSKIKTQIVRTLIGKIDKEQTPISLQNFSEQFWVLCTQTKIYTIQIPLASKYEKLQCTIKEFCIIKHQEQLKYSRKSRHSQKSSDVLSAVDCCLLSYPFVAVINNAESLLIIDVDTMKITNRIYNDVNFAAFDFNFANGLLVVSDFGGYLMSMSFNKDYGDIQQEGISYKKHTNSQSLALPINSKIQQFQTHYLHGKSPKKQKNSINVDPPTSKERKTAFSIVVQNTNRGVLQMLVTREKSVFSYEGKYKNLIKIWNISNLHCYQKVELTIKVNQMKVSKNGIYLISAQKGYLCYYPLQKPSNPSSKRIQSQILQLSASSNLLYISTTDMAQSIVYKLRLSNKPSLSEYCKKASKNAEKSFKFAFYKNEVILFNMAKLGTPIIQFYGIFGEFKQAINDLKDFHSMIKYSERQGAIIWSNNRVKIFAYQPKKPQIIKHYSKGSYILQTEPASTQPLRYSHSIIFNEQISKVKCFQHYIIIICNSNKAPDQGIGQGKIDKLKTQKKSNSFVIDESTHCITIYFQQLNSEKFRIIQACKGCTLFQTNEKVSNGQKHKNYFLYQHEGNLRIWQAEQIQGWSIQQIKILSVTQDQVQLIAIYKSSTIDIENNGINQTSGAKNENVKPLFYLIKYAIRLQTEQRKYINGNRGEERVRGSQNQTLTIEQILNRSIYNRITNQEIEKSNISSKIVSKNNYKLYFPYEHMSRACSKQKQKKGQPAANCSFKQSSQLEIDLKSAQSQILHYQKDQGALMVGVIIGSLAIIYEMEQEVQAQIVGVLDFNNQYHLSKDQEVDDLQTTINKCIVYWNQSYKKDDQDAWEETKNRAINRVKRKNQDYAFLVRTDSLRSTNKIWNPQALYEPISKLIKGKKNSQSLSKLQSKTAQTDPKKVNQLLYKHNIQQQIIKQNNSKIYTEDHDSIIKQKKRTISGKQQNDEIASHEIKQLVETVRLIKYRSDKNDTTSPTEGDKQSIVAFESTRKLKTEASQTVINTQISSRINSKSKEKGSRRHLKTEQALHQLQKSKIIEQLMLPKIVNTRPESIQQQKQKKNIIYDLLKKQNYSIKCSRYMQGKEQKDKS